MCAEGVRVLVWWPPECVTFGGTIGQPGSSAHRESLLVGNWIFHNPFFRVLLGMLWWSLFTFTRSFNVYNQILAVFRCNATHTLGFTFLFLGWTGKHLISRSFRSEIGFWNLNPAHDNYRLPAIISVPTILRLLCAPTPSRAWFARALTCSASSLTTAIDFSPLRRYTWLCVVRPSLRLLQSNVPSSSKFNTPNFHFLRFVYSLFGKNFEFLCLCPRKLLPSFVGLHTLIHPTA